jgi:thiol-disulfide isomerase/thioredoxin
VSDPEAGPPRHRLDPDRAAAGQPPDTRVPPRGRRPPPEPDRTRPPVINTRPYRIAIGLFGLVLLIAFSVYELTLHRGRNPTAVIGHQLPYFAAPLALSNLTGDANLHPPCTEARHDPRALNVCLLVRRAPLVLGFFVTDSGKCKRLIDTLQSLARALPAGRVEFAAVAVRDSHAATRATVRARRWTIPVAYDADGAVGASYEVEVCPMVVLARRGGVVSNVLIGNRWLNRAALAPRVRALLAG